MAERYHQFLKMSQKRAKICKNMQTEGYCDIYLTHHQNMQTEGYCDIYLTPPIFIILNKQAIAHLHCGNHMYST